jgi:protein-tyrosine phosphatase
MHPYSAEALTRLGGDPSGFMSRAFSASIADDADLVLTMTGRQRRAVLKVAPRSLRHVYTLAEAAKLVERVNRRALWSVSLHRRVGELAQQFHAHRAYGRLVRADDIRDPASQGPPVHAEVAAQIATAVWPLAAVIFGAPMGQDSLGSVETSVRRCGSLTPRGRSGSYTRSPR